MYHFSNQLYTLLSLLQNENFAIKQQIEDKYRGYLHTDLILCVPRSCLTYENGTFYLSMKNYIFYQNEVFALHETTEFKIVDRILGVLRHFNSPIVMLPVTRQTQSRLVKLNEELRIISDKIYTTRSIVEEYSSEGCISMFFNRGLSHINRLKDNVKEWQNKLYDEKCKVKLTLVPLHHDLIEIIFPNANRDELFITAQLNSSVLVREPLSISEKRGDTIFHFK